MPKNDGGQVFPRRLQVGTMIEDQFGMSMRQYYKAKLAPVAMGKYCDEIMNIVATISSEDVKEEAIKAIKIRQDLTIRSIGEFADLLVAEDMEAEK